MKNGKPMDVSRRSGFSLLELLTVVVIILVLAGITYRIGSYVMQRAGRSRAAYELELLHNILEEYYAVYGHYPPTSGVSYEDVSNLTGNNDSHDEGWNDYASDWWYYYEHDEIGPHMPNNQNVGPHGLYYYIWIQYNVGAGAVAAAPAAERAAYRNRWAHYLDELSHGGGAALQAPPELGEFGEVGTLPYSNYVGTITDPYGKAWQYVGHGPHYQSYQLYSDGPGDGSHPIGKDRWIE